MKKLIEIVLEKILIKDMLEFTGSTELLKDKLNKPNGRKFNVEWISVNEFKFLSKWSLGTMQVKGMPSAVDGIKGYGTIQESVGGTKVKVLMRTKVRPELYFIMGMISIMYFVIIYTGEEVPIWIWLLLPIFLLWFWGVYRIQEASLFKTVKKHLLR